MLITNYSTFPSSSLYYTTFDVRATRKNQQLDISYIWITIKEKRYNNEYINIWDEVNSCKWNSLPCLIFVAGALVCMIISLNKPMSKAFPNNGYSKYVNVKTP